jgi:(2Fe-2S) ferredoxin
MPSSDEVRACFVCTYTTCGKWGGQELLEGLIERLAGSSVRVRAYSCFGGCPTGPNIVLQPQGTWYADVQPSDLDEVAAHIRGGPPVERLVREVDEDFLRMALWMDDFDDDP